MRANIEIDDQLLHEAMRCSGTRTKKAVVEAGLRLLIQAHPQTSIRKLGGEVNGDGALPGVMSEEAKRVIAHAEAVFVDPKKAARWMQKPKRRFEGRTPLEMLATEAGTEQVETFLFQIESGFCF